MPRRRRPAATSSARAATRSKPWWRWRRRIAAVYPHMNHIGGDGFWLIREPNKRVRAIMAAGPAGSLATPALYREHDAIPSRGPLAALTVPGAIGGWKLAVEAARAVGGKGVPLPVLLHAAIGQARDGYTVTKSQARLTTEKLAELKNVPGFAQTFLPDGKPPEVGTKLKQDALVYTLDHLARVGLDDFYRGDVGREIAADLEKIGSPVTRDDLMRYRGAHRRSAEREAQCRHPLQHAAADPGARFADHPRAVRAPPRRRRRELRVRPRPGRGDQARVPRPRPHRHRSGCACRSRPPISSIRNSSTSRSRRSTAARRRNGRPRPARATPSGWAPPTRPASRCPTSSRSIGSSAPAACCPRPAC